jgi:GTPase
MNECMQVGANAGVVGMTKEHLGLALALGVPVFVVVTKIDMCPPNILQETLQMLHKILKSPGCRKMPVLVQTVDDVVVSATNFTSERLQLQNTFTKISMQLIADQSLLYTAPVQIVLQWPVTVVVA